MSFKKRLEGISLENKSLYYKLQIIFSFFFLIPTAGFFWFVDKHNLLNDVYILPLLAVFLIFSFFSFNLLRNIIDRIAAASRDASKIVEAETVSEGDELREMSRHLKILDKRLRDALHGVEERSSEIATMRDLLELSYAASAPDEILHYTLKRVLKLTKADIGSVLMLENSKMDAFIVQSNIGLEGRIKAGDRVDFSTSIAKYAVVNRTPLVVRDIEQDGRFGRKSLPRYGTKSFICMPIKTTTGVVGVLTITRAKDETPFINEDAEKLKPIVSAASFVYENIILLRRNEEERGYLKSLEVVSRIVNAKPGEDVSIHAILEEIKRAFSLDMIAAVVGDKERPGNFLIHDVLSSAGGNISAGARYPGEGSIFDRVTKRQESVIVEDCDSLPDEIVQGYKSCIFTPLRSEGDAAGVLVAAAEGRHNLYAIRKYMEIMACGISCAMGKNRLNSIVAKRSREMDTVRQIGSAIASSTFDQDKVLGYAMDMVRVALDAEAGILFLVDGDNLDARSSFNLEMEFPEEFQMKLGEGVAGHVAMQGESAIVNDVRQSPLYLDRVGENIGITVRSLLCVPLISRRKVIGAIELINKQTGDFDAGDEDLLASIASAVGSAMENARLYGETRHLVEHEQELRRLFQKYVPLEVVDGVIHRDELGKSQIEELKRLTLLNVEMAGFSKIVEKIGTGKSVSLLNSFFSRMGNIVLKHHGTVDKYVGDGFLAFFGAPISGTLDADHAVAAALEMKETIAEINDKNLEQFGVSVEMGITIHTGEVIVGNIGFDRKMDYTAVGDPVNYLLRLQSISRSFHNSVLMTEDTLAAARSLLNVREINVKEIDSSLGEVNIYELLGILKESVDRI